MKRFEITFLALVLSVTAGIAQQTFRFKRNIDNVQQQGWYTIALPDDIFKNLNRQLSDLRMFELVGSDTLETPYILDVKADVVSVVDVNLPVLNKSYRDGSLYLMFALNAAHPVNHVDLDFKEENFFGRVTLEGSDDRRQWFSIVQDQRIVSVNKGAGDYKLSRIDFPVTDYRFLRVSVASDVPLTFENAFFHHHVVEEGRFNRIFSTWESRADRKGKQTFVDIRLANYVPVSSIQVSADSALDYYRPMRIEFVADSFKTDKGWIRTYETLYDGYLTSFRTNEFSFPWKLARDLRIAITDHDNQPVTIHGISVAGPQVNILAKLKPGNNIMLYGSDELTIPAYDLAYFQKNIPDSLHTAKVGAAETLVLPDAGTEALFENKVWLWSIMVVMIGGLGFFTMRMMKQ